MKGNVQGKTKREFELEDAYHVFRDVIRKSRPGDHKHVSSDHFEAVLKALGLVISIPEFVEYANSLESRIVLSMDQGRIIWSVKPQQEDDACSKLSKKPTLDIASFVAIESSLKDELSTTLSKLGWEKQSEHQFIWRKTSLSLMATWDRRYCLTILQYGTAVMDIRISYDRSNFVLQLVKTWSDWAEIDHLIFGTRTST